MEDRCKGVLERVYGRQCVLHSGCSHKLESTTTLTRLNLTYDGRQATFRAFRVGMRIRNALIMNVYKQSLRLKATSYQDISTGQIVNLLANDTSKFE